MHGLHVVVGCWYIVSLCRAVDQSSTFVIPEIPWNDINIVVVTDVHSWIGRRKTRRGKYVPSTGTSNHTAINPDVGSDGVALTADYGDVLSFYRHLQELVRRHNQHPKHRQRDLWFVMNGDFVDGTGLSTIPPNHLTPLLQHMPWDAVNVGNHELYYNETVRHLHHSGFIRHWQGRYLSSNSFWASQNDTTDQQQQQQLQPLGNLYTYWHGTYTNATILVFGFLYNFQGHCQASKVQHVEEAVQQEWFRNVLLVQSHDETSATSNILDNHMSPRPYDAIVVLSHMDCVDDLLVHVLLPSIRNLTRTNVPIQFLAGHSHRRCFQSFDHIQQAATFEAGRYLDTIGFASFALPTKVTHEYDFAVTLPTSNDTATLFDPGFGHAYLDANRQTLIATIQQERLRQHATGLRPTRKQLGRNRFEFDTSEGRALSHLIHATQRSLGLRTVLGVSPRTYSISLGDFEHPNSLWGLYLYQVIPSQVFETIEANDKKSQLRKAFIQRTGAFRYNLFQGEVCLDDVIAVCPFNDTIYQVASGVTGASLVNALGEFTVPNADDNTTTHSIPSMPSLGMTPLHIDLDALYALYVPDFNMPEMKMRLEAVTGETYTPQPLVAANGQRITTTNAWVTFVQTTWSVNSVAKVSERVHDFSGRMETRAVALDDQTQFPIEQVQGTLGLGTLWIVSAALVVGWVLSANRKKQRRRRLYNSKSVENSTLSLQLQSAPRTVRGNVVTRHQGLDSVVKSVPSYGALDEYR